MRENLLSDDLKRLVEQGMMSFDDATSIMNKKMEKEVLKLHRYKISQGSDGYWRTYTKEENKPRRQILKTTYEKVIESLWDYYDPEKSKRNSETLETFYPHFIEMKKLEGTEASYIKRLDSDWKNHYKGTEIISKPLSSLTAHELKIWAMELIQSKGLTSKQYANISTIMRQLLQLAFEEGNIPNNPFKDVVFKKSSKIFRPVKRRTTENDVFNHEELIAFRKIAWKAYFSHQHTKYLLIPLAILFQIETGIRIDELCALKDEDISDGDIQIRRMLHFQGKNCNYVTTGCKRGRNDERTVPLTRRAKAIIQRAQAFKRDHNAHSEYLFSTEQGMPLPMDPTRKAYYRYCEQAGIAKKSSHKIRKTFITTLVDYSDMTPAEVSKISGNSTKTIFDNYYCDRNGKLVRDQKCIAALENL